MAPFQPHVGAFSFAQARTPHAARALLAAAVSAFSLPPLWAELAIGIQTVFYGLAATDTLVPESLAVKRLTSVARTFVVLMAASLCAVSICFIHSRTFWDRPTGQAGRA